MKDAARPEVLKNGRIFDKLHDISMKEIVGVGSEDDGMVSLKLFGINLFSAVIDPFDLFSEIELVMNRAIFRIKKKKDPEIFEALILKALKRVILKERHAQATPLRRSQLLHERLTRDAENCVLNVKPNMNDELDFFHDRLLLKERRLTISLCPFLNSIKALFFFPFASI